MVKHKYMGYLSGLDYYKSCAIAKKYLKSYPVPEERTMEQKKEKAMKFINNNVISQLEDTDEMLMKFKTEYPDKLNNPNEDL